MTCDNDNRSRAKCVEKMWIKKNDESLYAVLIIVLYLYHVFNASENHLLCMAHGTFTSMISYIKYFKIKTNCKNKCHQHIIYLKQRLQIELQTKYIDSGE